MRKKALAALLAAAMLAVTGCSGMPGMGTTNAPATKAGDEKAADAGSEANAGSNDTVYELKNPHFPDRTGADHQKLPETGRYSE